MKAVIGVDIGTQGTKAAIFAADGRCLGQEFVGSQLLQPAPGIVEEDPERQFASVKTAISSCCRKARISPEAVAAIGIDGQMAGIIGIGADGRAVTPYDSWLDTRCTRLIREMDTAAGDEILAKTGCAPSINHGPKKLWWREEHPETYRSIAAFVQPGGYAAMRLCGLSAADAFIDTTYLHFSGFADNAHKSWDASLCDRFALDQAKLPRIVEPQLVIGELTRSVGAECGLTGGIPVIAGCGDTAASFLACGATEPGVCIDVAGSASVFAATVSEFRPDREHRILGCGRSAVPGLWHPYAYINGGGINLEWFRAEIAVTGDTDAKTTLEQLNHLAGQITPSESDPLFVPHLGGCVCPARPNLRGAWVGLNWSHTRGHLYRAILESVALEYGVYHDAVTALYPSWAIQELRITGGGEKSDLWNRIKADVLDVAVRRINETEGAPRGVAMLAGWGVGLLPDLRTTAKQWVTTGETIQGKRTEREAGRLRAYKRLIQKLNELEPDLNK